jgi:hydrogenase maturation protease
MTLNLVEKIVNAVLYEGYILYPYRPSSTKNQQRFTFGRVYPQAFSEAQRGAEPCTMQTQCLVERGTDEPILSVAVRFLQPMAREVGQLAKPLATWSLDEGVDFQIVPEMRVNGRIYQTWQEVTERLVPVHAMMLSELVKRPCHIPFAFTASRTTEPILDETGAVIGIVARRQVDVAGRVEITAELTDADLFKVTVRILNLTEMEETAVTAGTENEVVLMRTFASTHTILTVNDGDFVSMMNPPTDHAAAVAACDNSGTWPILVGDEAAGVRDTLLSSPIILYDYPEIAPESPGDLFDGTEIDEILTLRIMTMTDEEKLEMRHIDERARQILQRTEGMSADHLMQMHGTMRDIRPFDERDS